ncbi:S41 family peptidase [Sphingobacterium paludis]|uniref:Peptidase S41-like protein n=1 Tax=Sphingobacterium paludis TaxID=1476465 RepID=A0A4V3E1X0_9SPHI|nr:S41 family peptidase [Sphingobacterium paludis]TDS14688.1 peptidase S41-like protein [Sphingobacterium paludis]
MKILVILTFSSITLLWQAAYGQAPNTRALVSEFIELIQDHAYMRHTIDLDSGRTALLEETKNISEISALKPHFKSFLKKLKDHHSSISYIEADEEDEDELDFLEKFAHITYEEAGYPPLHFKSDLLEGRFAYVNIPGVALEYRKYIETIGSQLQELDARNPEAWIFDVTENDGGSIIPMLWQMYALIDQDTIHSFLNSRGQEEKQTRIMWQTNGEKFEERLFELFKLNDVSLHPVKLSHTDIPIILLTSQKTASSGEFFVAAFKGQKNVTVIGQQTNGLTSGNTAYPLAKSYLLNLTTDVLKDRSGKRYAIGEGIAPDRLVVLDADLQKLKKTDAAVKAKYIDAALGFLREGSTGK